MGQIAYAAIMGRPMERTAVSYKTYTCPVQRACGGCQWLNVPYPIQLRRKQDELDELLGAFCEVDPILGMDNPLHYRNKVISPLAPGKGGKVCHGLFAQDSHRIVATGACLVEAEDAREVVATVARLAESLHLPAYDEDRKTGLLRHVVVRVSHASGECMVTLVCAGPANQRLRTLARELRKRHPQVSTVVLNTNTRVTNAVLGSKEETLLGPGFIDDTLCGLRFRISSRSFYQTNPLQTQVLYDTAMDMADLSGTQEVLDAYCGIGTIGLVAASRGAAHVLGVERNGDAVADAQGNARRNGIETAEFVKADAGDFMRGLAKQGRKADVVFMDPPRAGASPAFLKALTALAPQRVVYISCNPETQARDISHLVQARYRVRRVQPVDMFPHTPHVETVALLTRG